MVVKHYTDQIPPRSGRTYEIQNIGYGQSKIKDVTIYDQEGSRFGAADVNAGCTLLCSYRKTGWGHELTTPNTNSEILKFYATSDYISGDKIYFNGQEMIVKAADGMTLQHNAFLANTLVSALRYENQLFVQIKSALSDYPVGSVYQSFENVSPSYLFGGSWVQIENRFLYAVSNGATTGETAGEDMVSLTAANNGPHGHITFLKASTGNKHADQWTSYLSESGWNQITNPSGENKFLTGTIATPTGEGKPHNNMPPYITMYAWRRDA